MQELDKRIGLLRLLLADVQGKQGQLAEMETQYRAQLARIVEFVVYREGDVGNALALMSEVQAKLDEVVQTVAHLGMISSKATLELEALVLTRRVAEARSQLAKLEERQQELSAKLAHMEAGVETSSRVGEENTDVAEIRAIYDEVEGEITRLHSL